MKKKANDESWAGRMTPAPNAPEDHGRPYFSVPFSSRARFAINGHHYREPTITFYNDLWDSNLRRWIQVDSPLSVGLSTLRNLMALLEEELANG